MKKFAMLLCLTFVACVPPSGISGDSSSAPSSTPHGEGVFVASGCMVGGCSSQLCGDEQDEPMISTCEWTDAYACYRNARCEKQADGHCGWTMSSELSACLLNPPAVDA